MPRVAARPPERAGSREGAQELDRAPSGWLPDRRQRSPRNLTPRQPPLGGPGSVSSPRHAADPETEPDCDAPRQAPTSRSAVVSICSPPRASRGPRGAPTSGPPDPDSDDPALAASGRRQDWASSTSGSAQDHVRVTKEHACRSLVASLRTALVPPTRRWEARAFPSVAHLGAVRSLPQEENVQPAPGPRTPTNRFVRGRHACRSFVHSWTCPKLDRSTDV